MLEQALARARASKFYAGRLPERWSDVPLTTKDDLRSAYPFGMLAVPKSELATYHESSGTSGEPTASYMTEGDWDDVASRFARSAVGLGPADTVLVKTPYSMVTTAHQMHRAARMRGALVVPADNRSSNMSYQKVVRLLRDLPVTVAWCMPTEVLLWAEAARLQGLDPRRDFPALRAFLVAGEGLSEARRRRLSALWGEKQVIQDYGSTETGSLAGECKHGRLHLWSDRLHFEVVDGKLVVTTLYREAMPLVRYQLDDAVRISPQPCGCGWDFPVVEVLGRAGSEATVQGVTFFPAELEDCVFSLPLAYGVNFWRARYDADTLEIEIEGDSAASGALIRLIQVRLGVTASVRTVTDLVPRQALTTSTPFLKPRYLYQSHEDWRGGLTY